MNIPNTITLLRILLSPFFSLLYLYHESIGIGFVPMAFTLFFLLIFCETSDILDGFLARKFNQVSDLGKVLDPMADTVTHLSLFLGFTQGVVQLPLIPILIILYRDVFVSTLRTVCALKGVALAARPSGKLKAILQAVSLLLITALMVPVGEGWIPIHQFRQVASLLCYIVSFYTAMSAFDYFYSNRRYITSVFQVSAH
jgi:CDP-diacylglycerol--glycerol-3-phosphate 3-phosphatidyltransferase